MISKTGISIKSNDILAVILLLFLYITPITAEELLTPMDQQNFLTSGFYGGGLSFINGDAYVRLQLQPEIPIGKVRVGFDLVLLYNPYAEDGDNLFLAEDGEKWESASTWLRLIRFISYGDPYDPFYFRVGEFDYLTIGHGSIMSGYSNHDRRGIHLNVRRDDNQYGVETMLNDLGDPTIFGGRSFIRPFQQPANNNLFTRFEIGATYITDIDPIPLEVDEEPFNVVGVDFGFPIVERSSFRLDLYNDIALQNPPPDPAILAAAVNEVEESAETDTEETMLAEETMSTELTWGNATGIGFTSTKAILKFEYRIFDDGYIPTVFDYTYETGAPEFWGYEKSNVAGRGFFTHLIWHPIPQFHFLSAFEIYNNNTSKIYLGVIESGLVPRLTFRAFYAKRNIGEDGDTNFFADLFDLDEKSALNLEIRYMIFPPVETIVIKEYRFRRVQTDSGLTEFEPIHKTSIMFGVSTKF